VLFSSGLIAGGAICGIVLAGSPARSARRRPRREGTIVHALGALSDSNLLAFALFAANGLRCSTGSLAEDLTTWRDGGLTAPGRDRDRRRAGGDEPLDGVSHECDYPPESSRPPRVTRTSVDTSRPSRVIDRAMAHAKSSSVSPIEIDERVLRRLAPT